MLPNETRIVEWHRGPYTLSTDRSRMNIHFIHRFLAEESYWFRGAPRESVERSIEGSIALGIYCNGQQVGFARVITDCIRIAYLLDVFIDKSHRGKGLGTWLAETVRTHPDLTQICRWLLTTIDAQEVYERAGWKPVAKPEWMMEVAQPQSQAAESPQAAHASSKG